LIENEWIDVQQQVGKMAESLDDIDSQTIEKLELDILIDIIRNSMEKRNTKSILVFAESKKTVDKICEALRVAEIKSLPYYPDIAVQGRAMTLMLF
jgi:ERCC4-related helicase